MEDQQSTALPSFGRPLGPFRGPFADAIRYWEPRRLAYNLILIAVTAAWVVATWPHFRPALTLSSIPPMVVLALLANVCYCAAYVADFAMLQSSFDSVWRRRRWILWSVGTIFAMVLASYWIADEIYPDFR
jgi:MFS family permease